MVWFVCTGPYRYRPGDSRHWWRAVEHAGHVKSMQKDVCQYAVRTRSLIRLHGWRLTPDGVSSKKHRTGGETLACGFPRHFVCIGSSQAVNSRRWSEIKELTTRVEALVRAFRHRGSTPLGSITRRGEFISDSRAAFYFFMRWNLFVALAKFRQHVEILKRGHVLCGFFARGHIAQKPAHDFSWARLG